MQQTIPFKLDGANPKNVKIGVGDERVRLRIVWEGSSVLGPGASVFGWFNREFANAAEVTADLNTGAPSADRGTWEFMSGAAVGADIWWEVPINTAFVTVWAAAAGRGLIVLEQLGERAVNP